ncbi:LOW QUALITY PROTEIN: proline-rich protein 36-like [Kogia breviceps]|uniref:LOW QUALITY PROTEIN: proline-rich protein 36-like n=1 Tax=Kogia breviceps TaxID=27615 RepID=UPI0034D2FB1C
MWAAISAATAVEGAHRFHLRLSLPSLPPVFWISFSLHLSLHRFSPSLLPLRLTHASGASAPSVSLDTHVVLRARTSLALCRRPNQVLCILSSRCRSPPSLLPHLVCLGLLSICPSLHSPAHRLPSPHPYLSPRPAYLPPLSLTHTRSSPPHFSPLNRARTLPSFTPSSAAAPAWLPCAVTPGLSGGPSAPPSPLPAPRSGLPPRRGGVRSPQSWASRSGLRGRPAPPLPRPLLRLPSVPAPPSPRCRSSRARVTRPLPQLLLLPSPPRGCYFLPVLASLARCPGLFFPRALACGLPAPPPPALPFRPPPRASAQPRLRLSRPLAPTARGLPRPPGPAPLASRSRGGPCGRSAGGGTDGRLPALAVFLSCLGTDGPVTVSRFTEFISCPARSWDRRLHVLAARSSPLTGTRGHCPVT